MKFQVSFVHAGVRQAIRLNSYKEARTQVTELHNDPDVSELTYVPQPCAWWAPVYNDDVSAVKEFFARDKLDDYAFWRRAVIDWTCYFTDRPKERVNALRACRRALACIREDDTLHTYLLLLEAADE